MNKFEMRKKFIIMEPKAFLKSLLKLADDEIIKEFIKSLLSKIKEHNMMNKISILKSVIPVVGKNQATEIGTYDYTRTAQFEDRMNNLMKAMEIGPEYEMTENVQKYEILKEYLKAVVNEDIKDANVELENSKCIKVNEKKYGFIDQEEYKELCTFMGTKEKLEELIKENFFFIHCKNPDMYIVDADNEIYRQFMHEQGIEPTHTHEFEKTIIEEVVQEEERLLLEVGFISDESYRYNYETGTIVDCYIDECDVLVIPENITRTVLGETEVYQEIIPIREIDMGAFDGMQINKLVIPAEIENIYIDEDMDLSQIKEIELHPNNKNYLMVEGVLCSREGEPIRVTDYTTSKLEKLMDGLVNKSLSQNGAMENKIMQLKDGEEIHINVNATWKEGEKQVQANIICKNGETTEMLYTNQDYEYNSPLAKEDYQQVVARLNRIGIDKVNDNEKEYVHAVIRTFEKSLNRDTNKDYGFKGKYYIIDQNNPGNYMELESKRYEFRGKEETETSYKVFHDYQKVGEYNDRKDESWTLKTWLSMRSEMKALGDFSDEIAKLYNESDFIKYQEQLQVELLVKEHQKQTELEKQQNVSEKENIVEQYDKGVEKKKTGNRFNNFEQRSYDWEKLEELLLNNQPESQERQEVEPDMDIDR